MSNVAVAELVKQVGINEEELDRSCSKEDLVTVSGFLDWRVVGPHLTLTETEIAEIEAEGKREQEKTRKALQKWKGKCGFKATYGALVEALLKASQADVAEKVCQLLAPNPGECKIIDDEDEVVPVVKKWIAKNIEGIPLSNNDFPILCNLLAGVATKWMDIGIQLYIPTEVLDAIRANPKLLAEGNAQAYMRKMLSMWLCRKVQGVTPTSEALVGALQSPSVMEMKQASELEPKLLEQRASRSRRLHKAILRRQSISYPPPTQNETSLTHFPDEQVNKELKGKDLWWKRCRNAPHPVYRGSAASEGSMAYFRPSWSQLVLAFDAKEKWSNHPPPYPNKVFSLVIVKGHVTGVGGKAGNQATNALLSLTGEGSNARWAKHFPPMPTARWFTSPIFDGRYLIVAGGANSRGRFSTVEIMDTENHQWYTACSLPNPYDQLVAAIANEKLYLLGGMDRIGALTHSVLVCSLSDLLQSCNPPLLRRTASQPEQQLQPLTSHVVWHHVADIPVCVSACVSLGERIIAVGGYYPERNVRTSEVFTYIPDTNEWLVISHMPTARSFSMAVVLPNETVMVVGGNANNYAMETDTVEMGIFV